MAAAAVHVAVFTPVAYRALYLRQSFVGPNLFTFHTLMSTYAFDDWWRPATPGYLWQFVSRATTVLLGSNDPRLGALVATAVFYAVFGVALFELYRRVTSRWSARSDAGLALAVAASLIVAGLESPSVFGGWAAFARGRLFLPLYLPFAPTTIGSLGLNVLLLLHVTYLLSGRLPAAKRWRVPALVVLTALAKPTLLPVLVAAAAWFSLRHDLRHRRPDAVPVPAPGGDGEAPAEHRLLPGTMRLIVIPGTIVLALQTLTTIYLVRYPGLLDDRGGWIIKPLAELRGLDALTVRFWLVLILPIVALMVLGPPLWKDTAVRLAGLATVLGLAAAFLLARSGSSWKGDAIQPAEAAIAMMVIFIPPRLFELVRRRQAATWAVVTVGAVLALYVVAGIVSWSCHVGAGCPAG